MFSEEPKTNEQRMHPAKKDDTKVTVFDSVPEVPEDPAEVMVDPRSDSVEFYEVEMLDITLIDPNPWNPNEMDEKTFNRLAKEIEEVGFCEAIQVVPYEHEETGEARYLILGGEHRWRVIKHLGQSRIPAHILRHKKFSDVEFQKAMTIRLNVLRGRLNKERMVHLFQEFAEKHSENEVREMFAFTKKDEWDKLVRETRKNLKKSGMPPELLAEYDKNMKESRTVDDLGKIVQRLYQMYKDTVPYGFVVFTWGKKEHVYIAMNQKTKKSMDRLVKHCKENQVEINTLLAPAFDHIVDVMSEDDEEPPKA